MISNYLTHWILGIVCTVVWFFGNKVGVPEAAITLASQVVPALLGHAIAYTPANNTTPEYTAVAPGSQP